ncbi:MAG: GNAT family N-acetyltransferase [Gammaproteobacteria bacterium]
MKIDIATTADIPALCELLTELFEQEAEFRPDVSTQAAGLSRIIADSTVGHIFLARQNSRVVGMVSLLYSVSTALGGRVALLEDMVVAANHRGVGIGSQLIEHALAFARRHSCRRVTLLTDADNLSAQRFYRRHGFDTSAMVPMRLIFDQTE